jgi:hypothetical protein
MTVTAALPAAAAVMSHHSVQPQSAVSVLSCSASCTTCNRPAGPAAQNPLHSAKTIWLSFVRRAYRKFGKERLSDVDLRWRTRGASVLAAAWRRTDAACELTSAQRGSAHTATPNAVEEDTELNVQAAAESASSFSAGSSSRSAPAPPMPGTVSHSDMHRCSRTRRLPTSSGRASAQVQLQQAFTNMLSAGREGPGAHGWVLTWPSGMAELDVDQLVLLQRGAALHRSRNKRSANDVSAVRI